MIRVVLGSMAVVAVVAAMSRQAAPPDPPDRPEAMGQAVAFGSAEAWTPVAAPDQVFSLAPAILGARLSHYEARVDPERDFREDRAVFGRFDGDGNVLALTFARGRDDALKPPSYFLALVRSAAASGLAVLQIGPRRRLDTKFGTAEVAQALLSRREARSCLSFRVRRTSRDYGLSGWMCGEGADIDDLSRLARLIAAVEWHDPGEAGPA